MRCNKIELIYQQIANKFVEMIPTEWNKILLFCEVGEGTNSIHYVFYERFNDKSKDSESLINEFGMDRDTEMMYSVEISELIMKLQKAFVEQGLERWNIVTFILESTGEFKFDFEYADLDASDEIIRRKEWEDKYINV